MIKGESGLHIRKHKHSTNNFQASKTGYSTIFIGLLLNKHNNSAPKLLQPASPYPLSES
jgi:hypothetical protein